jgi:hypothetical protein
MGACSIQRRSTYASGKFARRMRDLIYQHEADLGSDNLNEGQRALVRRISLLQCQLENLERTFAENDGNATPRWVPRVQRDRWTRLRPTTASGAAHLSRTGALDSNGAFRLSKGSAWRPN